MYRDKEYKRMKKKIFKSIRTHLAKRVIFNINLEGASVENTKSLLANDVDHVILVVSHNSKIDMSDANNLISHMSSVRTYSDLGLRCELNTEGIDIKFTLNNIERNMRLHIFKTKKCASNKLVGYITSNGMKYTWIEIVDYAKHPVVVTTDTHIFHKIVARLILKGEKVDNGVDWTSLIELEKFKYARS